MAKWYTLLFLSLFLFACRSAQKSFDNGRYEDALAQGVKQLQKNPGDAATLQVVKEAYRLSAARYEENIRALNSSRSDDRFARILRYYEALQNLSETVQAAPVAYQAVQPVNYASYIETYRDKAAEVHRDKAEALMQAGNKQAYRAAYQEFKQALHFKPKDRQLQRQRDSAYNAALTRVVVLPLQTNLPYHYASSYQLQNFENDVMRTLANNWQGDFVQFYTEWEARSRNVQPDQILEWQLGRVYLGQPYDRTRRRTVSKKVVVKETVYKPDSVVKEWATVQALVQTTERTVVSEGELFISLRDPQGRIVWSDRFTGAHQWQTRFATYTGDERALSDSDKQEMNQPQNGAPREDEVLEELFRRINSDLSYRLRNFYARY